MSKIDVAQVSFAGGEQTPLLGGRTDITKYPIGCKRLENYIVLLQGGLARRPGSVFAGYVHNNSINNDNNVKLIPFNYSVTQTYIIEMSAGYIRFFKTQALLEASPGVEYVISNIYSSAQIPDIRYTQSADVLYLFHSQVRPKKLTRTGPLAWTIVDLVTQDGPYLDINATATTVTFPAGGVGANIGVTSSTGIFAFTDVNRVIRVKSGTTWSWGTITSVSTPTACQVTLGSANALVTTTAWALGLFSSTTGWPSCGAFYEERLWLGGSSLYPQTLAASVSGSYEVFSPTDGTGVTLADSGLVYTISSDDINSIVDLNPGKILSVLTTAAEFSVSASSLNEAITPTNIKISRETTRGSRFVKSVRVDSEIIHVQRSGRKVREYGYSFQDDSFTSIDLTTLAEHITRGSIKELAYAQEPYSLVWARTDSGRLICLTYNREQDTVAWHNHPLGKSTTTPALEKEAKVLSIAVISSPNTFYDELWMVVQRRTIAGAIIKTVEYLSEEVDLSDGKTVSDCTYLDSSLRYSGAATSSLSGLDHLIGQTVSAICNGAVVPDQVVSGTGTVAVPAGTTKAVVGLKYSSIVTTNSIEVGGNQGTSQGQIGRIHSIDIFFQNTIGCRYGRDFQTLLDINFRTPSDDMDEAPPLYSGYKEVILNANPGSDKSVTIVQDQPYPNTIIALVANMVVYG